MRLGGPLRSRQMAAANGLSAQAMAQPGPARHVSIGGSTGSPQRIESRQTMACGQGVPRYIRFLLAELEAARE